MSQERGGELALSDDVPGGVAEDDDSLTAEEKAVMRFQQQRLKEAASNKFALTGGSDDEDGGLGLTHGGRPLADAHDQGLGERPNGHRPGEKTRWLVHSSRAWVCLQSAPNAWFFLQDLRSSGGGPRTPWGGAGRRCHRTPAAIPFTA